MSDQPVTSPPQDPYVTGVSQAQGLQVQGKIEDAISAYLQLHKEYGARIEIVYGLGVAYQQRSGLCPVPEQQKEADAFLATAEKYMRQACALDPGNVDVWNSLGSVKWGQKDAKLALEYFERALAITPTFEKALFNLGIVNSAVGNIEASVRNYEAAMAISPTYFQAHQNLIFLRDVEADDARAWKERRNIWIANKPSGRSWSLPKPENPDKRLRIGYLSADFWMHSACFIFGSVILSHNWDEFHPIAYHTGNKYDFISDRVRDHVIWRGVHGATDEQLGQLIRSDGIDILVDLSAFSYGTRLSLFRERIAPVQVTAWGHALGTGLPEMDYILMDAVAGPDAQKEQFRETQYNLPCLMCYAPPAHAPGVAPLPARTKGHVTFGSFNRIMKLNRETWMRWGEILKAVPDSRLIVKCVQFDVPAAIQNMRARMEEFGIESHRVDIRGQEPHLKHLASYGEVDLSLDPFPHGGGITTVEGMWAGVPVITHAGTWVASRIGASLLTNIVGVATDFIATSRQEYIDKAVYYATHLDELEKVRQELRPQMAKSSLCDIPAYTRAVEKGYREMWMRACVAAAE